MTWWNPWGAAREALELVAEQREVLNEQNDLLLRQQEAIKKLQLAVLEQHKLLARAVFRDPKTGRMVKAKK